MRHSVRAAIDPVDPFANNMGWSIDFHHRLLGTKKDMLSRRQRLEAVPGWVWNTMDAAWEEGFGHLTTYVQAHKDARVPRDYTAEGYLLGRWVAGQRWRKDSMSAESRQRLAACG